MEPALQKNNGRAHYQWSVDFIRFMLMRLMVVMVWIFFASISNAAATDTWLQNGYKTIVKLFGGENTKKEKDPVFAKLRNDGRPVILRYYPSERSGIRAATYLSTNHRYVEILKGCVKAWCHVRLGLAYGWLKKHRLELGMSYEEQAEDRPEEPEQSAAPLIQNAAPVAAGRVNIPLPVRKGQLPPARQQVKIAMPVQNTVSLPFRKVIEKTETAEPRDKPVVASLKLSEISRKKYSLARVQDVTFLPVRLDHADDATIMGGIPFFANDVEALGLCVDDWCLVQRGELRGWIRQYHLSDTHEEYKPRLKLQNTKQQNDIALYQEPDMLAEVASYVDAEATGIVPVGACDLDWCHVLHENKTGWIQSKHLSRQ